MIVSMLQKFIDKHSISVLELSKRSGVSRPSLTALATNKGKGVQFDTLEKLCRFFHVGINEMLVMFDEQDCTVWTDDLDSVDFSKPQKSIRSGTVHLSDNISFDVDCIIDVSDAYCADIDFRLTREELENDELSSFLSVLSNANGAKQAINKTLEKSAKEQLTNALMGQAPEGEIISSSASISFW